MIVTPVKTHKILPGAETLSEILDKYLPKLKDGSVLAITSKIVSLCEGNYLPVEGTSKEDLIVKEADYILPSDNHKYGYHFSVIDGTLIASSGIDESNGSGNYVLWPKDAQHSANSTRDYLVNKTGLKNLGVIITDSTSKVMRRGAVGICLAHSGFQALHDYRGTDDLFGHEFQFSVANHAEGLAGAAVMVMGEGTEQTPLAIIEDIPFISFRGRNPSKDELDELKLTLETDYFEIFLSSVPWQKGGRNEK